MDEFKTYIIKNFLLICMSIVLYINSILRYKQHPKISQCVIAITTIALALSVSNAVVAHTISIGDPITPTILYYFGYVVRPVCIWLLLNVSGIKFKKKYYFFTYLPLLINATVYLFAFIPATKEAVYYFTSEGGEAIFHGGPLRFSSHIISALYLAFLVIVSIKSLGGKHVTNTFPFILCTIFVVASVVIESFFSDNGNIDYLLNSTILVSTIVYYLFLYNQKKQIDTLTGLFNRETFYSDVKKMDKSITGVIQFDMNGLKYLNDNFGHLEGDKALAKIGNILYNNSTRKMYVYRLGGDEFTLIALNSEEDIIKDVIGKIKEDIAETKYHCSIGYAYRGERTILIDDLLKEAETNMYEDKARFYQNSNFDRRRAEKI